MLPGPEQNFNKMKKITDCLISPYSQLFSIVVLSSRTSDMPGFDTATSPVYSGLGCAHLGSRGYLVFGGSSFLLHTFQKRTDNYGSWLGIVVSIMARLAVAARNRHNVEDLRLSMLYRKASFIRGPATKLNAQPYVPSHMNINPNVQATQNAQNLKSNNEIPSGVSSQPQAQQSKN